MNYETALLKTKRLIMKRGEKEDFFKVYEYNFSKLKNIDDVCKLVKQDTSKLEKVFKNGTNKYYTKLKKAHMFDWIVYLNENPIGNILTTDEDLSNKSVEISFNLHPKYWGKGFMPEALTAVIEYLYSLGYDNVICTYQDGNIRAKRVLDKLGFRAYKIIKDSFKCDSGNIIDNYKVIMTKEDWFSRTGKIIRIGNSL